MSFFGPTETLGSVLFRSVVEAPDQCAIHLLSSQQADLEITYHHLYHEAANFAQQLRQRGLIPGDVCILILNHSPELIYSFWGAILAGVIPAIMPFLTEKLSPSQYRASLEALFVVTHPRAVITSDQFEAEVIAARGNNPKPEHIFTTESLSPLRDPIPDFRIAALPEDTVLLQHSSGTTGLQKGIALSHRAVINQLNSYSQAIQLGAGDVVVSWLPLYHDMGLIAGFLLPILCRTPLVLMSPFDWVRAPYKLLQAVTQFRGTLTWLPNFAYNFCAQKISDRNLVGLDLSTWRAVINCSEPMHWSSHQMFIDRFSTLGLRPEALATSYAMAENVFAVTQGGIESQVRIDSVDQEALIKRQVAKPGSDSARVVKMVSAGRAIDNTRIRVIDSRGHDIPERRVGEIAIHSNCMLSGYYNRPDLTEAVFLDGWYLTGDLGYLADGELYITGRKKDLIIVGGKNIYPQDLERLAGEVAGVHPGRVVAFGVYNERAGTEDVVLVAETDLIEQEMAVQIGDLIRARVTTSSDITLRYAHIVPRGWLLKTSSGKIARSANRDKFLSEVGWGSTSPG
jgi:acyl-CoA synthetase (AMP-forming)/AMP-acid ligase II